MIRLLRPAVLLAALLCAAAPALAQKMVPSVIAVIDHPRITREAAVWESARKQYEQIRQQFQQEFQPQLDRLAQERQEIERQRTVLSPDAWERKGREWERRDYDLKQRGRDRERELEQILNNARTEINKRTIEVVGEIVKERSINVVLERLQTPFSDPALDITPEVIKRLNQKMPSIRISSTAPAPAR
jgi:Skp family chaperone for outer membrane proteins